MADLKGKSVVITGAGQGIGAAYARAAASAGAKVVVNDINRETAEAVAQEIRKEGGTAVAEPQDVRDPKAAEALIRRCIDEFGAITGLVNNAALFVTGPFESETVDHLRALLETNVVGLFNCGRAAVGPMLRQGEGSIVNITSGAQTGQTGLSTYGATKGAVASLTYGWAAELRGRGVRVNAVSPMASSPMSNFNPHLPAPETNAPPVLFLLSDEARDLTGQVIRIVGRKLSVMCHPAIRAPVLERETWTLDDVVEAFRETLAANQVPTDVATYEIAGVRLDPR
jgi:NAD(P)-dependent dehydrogenase (short-subunit alcohol dehydrogenase family)